MTKILLVEDDKSLREIYGVRLLAEGYDIVSAGDGEEALALAIKDRPALIVSDVMMPKISGFDMLDILRSTTETKDIKVIMMTALSSEEQRQRGESLGADRYLVKSQVGIEDVVRAVHEVLGDGSAPATATPAPAPPVASQPPAPATPTPTPPPSAQPASDTSMPQPQTSQPQQAAPAAPTPGPMAGAQQVIPVASPQPPAPIVSAPTPPAAPAPQQPTPVTEDTTPPQPALPKLGDRVIEPLAKDAVSGPSPAELMKAELFGPSQPTSEPATGMQFEETPREQQAPPPIPQPEATPLQVNDQPQPTPQQQPPVQQ